MVARRRSTAGVMAVGSEAAATFAHNGGRAFRPGLRRGVLAVITVLAAAVAAVVLSSGGGSTHPHNAAASLRYGQIPSWIPRQKQPSDSVVSATIAKPVLAAVEGDTVLARLPGSSAYVTALGPSVPNWVQTYAHRNLWTADSLAPSTFTFTIAHPEGPLPLRASDFEIQTEEGQIVHPAVSLANGRPLPATVKLGRSVTLTLRAKLPEGEGAIRWADGNQTLVVWMYSLELD
jgi:hypothetical protein